jgi:nicotinate phosphoribosyltransferase
LAQASARAAFIGGCAGTTHALAAKNLSIPIVGLISDTMLAAYEDVALAYEALSAHFPDGCHLNLPTEGPLDAIDRFERIHSKVQTVRIDHPDLGALSRAVRQKLDDKGMKHTRILGSGALDAARIQDLVAEQAPIDIFAVGQALVQGITGSGPQLSYRMAAFVRGAAITPVTGQWSAEWPGIKQVHRYADHDVLCTEVESAAHTLKGAPKLLLPWVLNGERTAPTPSLRESREHCQQSIAALAPTTRHLLHPEPIVMHASQTVQELAKLPKPKISLKTPALNRQD